MSEHLKNEAPPESVFQSKSEFWAQIDKLKADHEANIRMVVGEVASHWKKAKATVTWDRQGRTWRARWRHEGVSYNVEGPGADGLREAIQKLAEPRKRK